MLNIPFCKGFVVHQAFILPLPKTVRSSNTEESETDPQKEAELAVLRTSLDKLRSGQWKWDEFLSRIDLADSSLHIATTKEGDTLLHLAALYGRKEIFDLLSDDVSLRWKRNVYGMTAFEIAQFLHRKDLLPPSTQSSFCAQPGVQTASCSSFSSLEKLEFLSHPIFESGRAFYNILGRSQKAKLKDQIPPEKIWMGIYFDKEIQQGLHPPVSIRFVDKEVGLGLFAEARIPSCAYVGEYTGVVSERKKRHLEGKTYCVRYTVWEMGRKNFVIDAEEKGNCTRFINHSARPNLSLQSVYWRGLPRMIFVALKEIPEGTQLTFDYGTFFWKECHQVPKLF